MLFTELKVGRRDKEQRQDASLFLHNLATPTFPPSIPRAFLVKKEKEKEKEENEEERPREEARLRKRNN